MTQGQNSRQSLGKDLVVVSRLLLSHGGGQAGWAMFLLASSALAEGASLTLMNSIA